MNLPALIKQGRLDPILELDDYGTEMLLGWQRKSDSRKTGRVMLPHPLAWIRRDDVQAGRAQTPGVRIVLAQRQEDSRINGFGDEDMILYPDGQLARAAQCYEFTGERRKLRSDGIPEAWPWEPDVWKPGPRIRELARAGAFYMAEYVRLTRAGEKEKATLVSMQALGCATGIDNIYQVTPLSPGPHMIGQ